MKTCTKCKEDKELGDFYKDKTSPDGHMSYCKVCKCKQTNAYKANNKAKIKEESRQYYLNNKDAAKARRRARYLAKKDLIETQVAKYRANNLVRIKEAAAEWRRNNKSKCNEYHAKRRAIKRETGVKSCPMVKALYEMARILSNTCEPMHVDHIIPLAKGGTHTFENMQILTAQDNWSKNAKLDWVLPDDN